MEILSNHTVRQWAAQFQIVLCLTGGFLVFAVGAGLLLWNQRMQRIFVALNGWVSTRRVLRPVEIPHNTSPAALKYRYVLAAFFIAGGVYSLLGLATGFSTRAFMTLLSMQSWPYEYAAWLVNALRWVLLTGSAVAIAMGITLVVSPSRMAALEASGGRWFSDRRIAKGADAMHMPLDRWVAAHPQAAGWIFAVTGLVMVGDFCIILSKMM